MNLLQKIGIALFLTALVIFTLSLGMGSYKMDDQVLTRVSNEYHREAIKTAAVESGVYDQTVNSNIEYISKVKSIYADAQSSLNGLEIPANVSEWDFKFGDWKKKEYLMPMVKASSTGFFKDNAMLFFLLTFGLGILGGLLFIIPKFSSIPGIKNNGVYHFSYSRGIKANIRNILLYLTLAGVLLYGFFYMQSQWFWPALTLAIVALLAYLVFIKDGHKALNPPKSASPMITGWVGLISGLYLIGFYVILYWKPEYLTNWILMLDPISESLSGNRASEWFLYGFLYTIIVLVMGIRMMSKYRHNKYQLIRTCSVMFFQLAFAFLLPEILVRLNQPWFDFKNIWPLNYTFFFDWNINQLMSSGGLGLFMLVWGIALIIIGVPVITYFFGKRWYCSWVCGCGGLAETMGDPYRQLSDKSLRAWKFERYIIHGVLVFAVVMTALVLTSFFSGSKEVLFLNSDTVRTWYGFLIGSAFAGVVGTGFYPIMGNRVWCRFGCPLAAYLGLVQKFKSRFRITTNGGQCISCGNCSAYCEMGIDVRWYAQRGQDIVRSSCVGCGVCSAVCPRGVLRLENGSLDLNQRAEDVRNIHV